MSQELVVKVNQYAWTKEFKKLEKAFEQVKKESRRDARKILLQQARLFCIDLMFVTNPFGKNIETKKKIEGSVKKDIKRVYMTSSDIYESVNWESKEQAAAFYGLMKRGREKDLIRARGILKRLNVSFIPEDFDGGQYHKSKRNRRGRVSKSAIPKLINNKAKIKKYTKEVVKKVGFAKSGFGSAAIALSKYPQNNGNTRGIPAWIKRHALSDGAGTAYLQKGKDQETVIIINRVRYIRNLVGKAQILSAMKSRARSMSRLARKVIEINAQNKIRKKLMNTMTAGL